MILPFLKKFIDKFIKKNNGPRDTIVAINKQHLKKLIKREMHFNGKKCDLNHIDVSQVTTMIGLFRNSKFNGNISSWNVSKVEYMGEMFYNSDFNGDISNWDVSNVKDMESMFYASKFNEDISSWNVSKVENMKHMFAKSQFNGDISNWNVSNVVSMKYMFTNSKFDGKIKNWDISNVKNMYGMFSYSQFIEDLSDWKPCSAYIENAFYECLARVPYWAEYEDLQERRKAIDSYHLEKHLSKELIYNNSFNKRLKL